MLLVANGMSDLVPSLTHGSSRSRVKEGNRSVEREKAARSVEREREDRSVERIAQRSD